MFNTVEELIIWMRTNLCFLVNKRRLYEKETYNKKILVLLENLPQDILKLKDDTQWTPAKFSSCFETLKNLPDITEVIKVLEALSSKIIINSDKKWDGRSIASCMSALEDKNKITFKIGRLIEFFSGAILECHLTSKEIVQITCGLRDKDPRESCVKKLLEAIAIAINKLETIEESEKNSIFKNLLSMDNKLDQVKAVQGNLLALFFKVNCLKAPTQVSLESKNESKKESEKKEPADNRSSLSFQKSHTLPNIDNWSSPSDPVFSFPCFNQPQLPTLSSFLVELKKARPDEISNILSALAIFVQTLDELSTSEIANLLFAISQVTASKATIEVLLHNLDYKFPILFNYQENKLIWAKIVSSYITLAGHYTYPNYKYPGATYILTGKRILYLFPDIDTRKNLYKFKEVKTLFCLTLLTLPFFDKSTGVLNLKELDSQSAELLLEGCLKVQTGPLKVIFNTSDENMVRNYFSKVKNINELNWKTDEVSAFIPPYIPTEEHVKKMQKLTSAYLSDYFYKLKDQTNLSDENISFFLKNLLGSELKIEFTYEEMDKTLRGIRRLNPNKAYVGVILNLLDSKRPEKFSYKEHSIFWARIVSSYIILARNGGDQVLTYKRMFYLFPSLKLINKDKFSITEILNLFLAPPFWDPTTHVVTMPELDPVLQPLLLEHWRAANIAKVKCISEDGTVKECFSKPKLNPNAQPFSENKPLPADEASASFFSAEQYTCPEPKPTSKPVTKKDDKENAPPCYTLFGPTKLEFGLGMQESTNPRFFGSD